MGIGLEVARYDIVKNAILPTLKIKLRSKNQNEKYVYFSSAMCEVRFGKALSGFADLPLVAKVPTHINYWVKGYSDYEFEFDLTLTQEILYKLDKLINSQQDVYFVIKADVQFFYTDQTSKIEQATHDGGECVLDVKMSDWARIAYDWGKEMALMPISPKLFERIHELMRNSKYFKGTDDVIDELLNRYAKQELEQ